MALNVFHGARYADRVYTNAMFFGAGGCRCSNCTPYLQPPGILHERAIITFEREKMVVPLFQNLDLIERLFYQNMAMNQFWLF
jgi:hypothetical protein